MGYIISFRGSLRLIFRDTNLPRRCCKKNACGRRLSCPTPYTSHTGTLPLTTYNLPLPKSAATSTRDANLQEFMNTHARHLSCTAVESNALGLPLISPHLTLLRSSTSLGMSVTSMRRRVTRLYEFVKRAICHVPRLAQDTRTLPLISPHLPLFTSPVSLSYIPQKT